MEANTIILGVSRDVLIRHARLAGLLQLRFPLLPDEAGDVGVDYGALAENRWAGSNDAYDINCSAFLIDRSGVLRYRATPDFIQAPTGPSAEPDARLHSRLGMWLGEPTVLHATELLRAAPALNR
jgi:peroxiredoxin